MPATATEQRDRAIIIVRVSEEAGRGERLASYDDQEARGRVDCERIGATAIDVLREENVSGGAPLESRAFGDAITRVENGEAEVIVFAHRDRADRSIVEGGAAIERMDRANGVLMAGGQVLSHRTAAQWRDATFGSFMGESYRRELRERSMSGVARRIREGKVVPFRPGPGFIQNDDGTVKIDRKLARPIREAWAMRARGETYRRCREYLAAHGVERSYRAVQIMFRSPLYVGEVHRKVADERGRESVVAFSVCEPMIERGVYDAVQARRESQSENRDGGRQSDALLARTGILRCGSCGARMVAGGQTFRYTSRKTGETSSGRYAFYVCGADDGDCDARATISAAKVEPHLIDYAVGWYENAEGFASHVAEANEAAEREDQARAALAATKRRLLLFPDAESDEEAAEIVRELTVTLHAAEAEAKQLASVSGVEVRDAPAILRSTRPSMLSHRRTLLRHALPNLAVRQGRAAVAERVPLPALG
jgi:hypothetical protein